MARQSVQQWSGISKAKGRQSEQSELESRCDFTRPVRGWIGPEHAGPWCAMLLSVMLLCVVSWLPAGAMAGEQSADTTQQTDQKPVLTAFASVVPLVTFVEAIGGERVRVLPMVLPGQSPATYDPSPRQVSELSEAAVYFRVGVPFEQAWMKRIQAANPAMVVVDLREGLPLRTLEAHDHDHAHEHHHDDDHHHKHQQEDDHQAEAKDPHIWTSPELVRRMAVQIRDTLTRLDPEGAADYAANQAAFDAELVALDQWLSERLSDLENRRFLVYHPAWGYFADAYGLTQVTIEYEGKEPGARQLAALIDQAKGEGTRVVFVQPEFNQRAATQVAQAIDGRVEKLNPLAPNYMENLRQVADIIATANGRDR